MSAGIVALVVLSASAGSAAAPPARADARCQDVLAASAAAYRGLDALREVLTYQLDAPGAERESKKLEVGFDAGGAYMDVPGLRMVAAGGELAVIRGDAKDTYVSVPYAGDFGAAVDRAAGEPGKLAVPAELVMRSRRDSRAWIDALRFALLGPLELVGCEVVPGDGDERLDELRFRADNGSFRLRLERASHLFSGLALEMIPPGAPKGIAVRIEGRYTRRVPGPGEAPITADHPGRRAVGSLSDLVSSRSVVGRVAPEVSFEDLAATRVSLASLRGKVVVLDFWATWCAPCWKGLRESQALADWASAEGLPVVVLAVNTLEQAPDAAARRERVTSFWATQGLKIRPVLDLEGAAFEAFASPGLPSTIVVGPDGVVVTAHTDVMPDLQDRLRAAVRRAVEAKGR